MTATLSGQVYAKLRRDIVDADLPPGGKLRIDTLCERYSVTSTPVREALNQLASEGFVLRREQRGFLVATASLTELAELTQTRCWVETIALREAILHRTTAWDHNLRAAWADLEGTPRSTDAGRFVENPQWEPAHRRFHAALVATCPSHWLVTFCGQLSDHATRYRRLAMSAVFPRRNVTKEHKAILDAALSGQVAAAVAALEAHYRRTAGIVTEAGLAAGPNQGERV